MSMTVTLPASVLATGLPLASTLTLQINSTVALVMAGLGVALCLVWFTRNFSIVRVAKTPPPAPLQASPQPPASAPGTTAIPAHIQAVIAAAVSTAFEDRQFVIHGIHTEDPRGNLAWGAEGRRSIYASKNLR
jgi:hypothetical protein